MVKESVKTVQWLSSEVETSTPFITLDSQLRMYFNAGTRKLIGDTKRVQVGYDFDNKRILIADAQFIRPVNVKPHKIDARGYASARAIIDTIALKEADLPKKYQYVGKDFADVEYPEGVLAFEEVEEVADSEE